MGLYDPAPVATIVLNGNSYLSNATTIFSCVGGFNHIQVYMGNPAAGPQSIEVAIYDNLNQVSAAFLTAPGLASGWVSASVAPFTITCGDSAIMAVYNEGASLLYLGASGNSCQSDSGTEPAAMPATYPNSSILAAPATGPCYEVEADSCGLTPTPTNTP